MATINYNDTNPLSGTEDDDVINNGDSLTAGGSSISILGGAGDDFIYNSGSYVTINAGAGNDTISLASGSKNNVIEYTPSEGNDTIVGFDGTSVLKLTEGSVESVEFSGRSATMSIGGGVLTFKNFDVAPAIKVINADGTSKIYATNSIGNSSNEKFILSGDSNDTITNIGNEVTIESNAGDDDIYNTGSKVTIKSNSGSDTIENYGVSTTIDADAGADFLINGEYFRRGGTAVSMSGGAGNDTISNNGLNALINGNADNDLIFNGFSYYKFPDTITTDNRGKIYFYDTDQSSLVGGDYSTVNGGAENDTIANHATSSTINGDEGDDYIYNGYAYDSTLTPTPFYGINIYTGDYSEINGGDGADKIFNQGYAVLIDGGDDNDSISNGGASATINGGEGLDTILNSGDNVSINSGAGNDYIYSDGSEITINGGAGNDHISLSSSSKNNVIKFNEGDGIDTVYGFGTTDEIQVSGTVDFSSIVSGNDLILSNGTDSITIIDAGFLSTINVSGISGIDTTTSFINNNEDSLVSTAAKGTKNIISFGRTRAVYLIGDAEDNSLTGGRGIDTLDGAGGDDTLTGSNGNDIFVYSSGNDVITDYGTGGDIISLSGAEINDVDIDGNNVALKFTSGGSLTINDGYKVKNKNRVITFLEEKTTTSKGKTTTSNVLKSYVFEEDKILNSGKTEIILTAGTETFDASTKDNSKIKTINATAVSSEISIQGNTSANKIYAGNHGSTLNGGKGNDTLYGGNGADVFIYENRGGKDVIVNYTGGADNDTISLSGKNVEISKVSLKKSDVIFTVGSKSLTVKEASTSEIVLDENGTTKIYSGGLMYNEDKTSGTVTAAYPARTKLELDDLDNVNVIDASSAIKALNIIGSSSANTILGSAKKDTIAGSSGADSLSGGKGNDSMKGGDGDDTLIGGKGNDLLWGEDGADTFIYTKGDGKDTIYGFDNSDWLQIDGTVDLYYTQRKEVSVKVGSTSNAIILKNFGTTDTFHVNNDTWKLSDGTIKKV